MYFQREDIFSPLCSTSLLQNLLTEKFKTKSWFIYFVKIVIEQFLRDILQIFWKIQGFETSVHENNMAFA
jgi:hypothetical protein